jgi:rhodanese-related sulfurtransferase
MKRTFSLCLLGVLALAGCRADLTDLQVAGVQDVAAWRSAGVDFTLCDANNEDTRTRFGVIPGALLLSDYRDYDVAGELPADRDGQLVFYCHSEWCGAAADAARKALAAGYRDVWVMEPGVRGWNEAGEPIESAPEGSS